MTVLLDHPNQWPLVVMTPDAGTHVTTRPQIDWAEPLSAVNARPGFLAAPRIINDRANQPYQDQRPDPVLGLSINIGALSASRRSQPVWTLKSEDLEGPVSVRSIPEKPSLPGHPRCHWPCSPLLATQQTTQLDFLPNTGSPSTTPGRQIVLGSTQNPHQLATE